MTTPVPSQTPEQATHVTEEIVSAPWWRQAVVYQIYPRSFADANGDGLGDLAGITLARRLPRRRSGIDAVWLSPFYPSALADGGYDVDDYRDVDPRLGTLDDFDAMVAALHAAGIKVIVDIVPNHTSEPARVVPGGAGAPAAARRRASATSSATGPGPTAPSRRRTGSRCSAARPGSASPDGQWYLHLFAPEQPDLNWDNPEVRDDFLTTLRFWSDRGVDGFRVDVAHMLAKDLTEPLPTQGGSSTRLPLRRQPPALGPRRGARDLRRVARGLQRVRPAAHRRRRGLGRAAARVPATPAPTAWARRSTSTCSGRLRRRRSSAQIVTDNLAARRRVRARRPPGCCPTTTSSGTPPATGCPAPRPHARRRPADRHGAWLLAGGVDPSSTSSSASAGPAPRRC